MILLLSLIASVATFSQLVAAEEQYPLSHAKTTKSWNLNFSSLAPYHFHSIHSLLQAWPNSYFANGHTLAPGTIPPFTKLYHGRQNERLPPSPEWLAFDIDMSYGIMGGTSESHMLTYQTTRPVKALYFDGASAALMSSGRMDSQMLQIFGNVTGPPDDGWGHRGLNDEYMRARGLCDWLTEEKLGGLGWGFEAFVRMNAGFEVIWCDFASPSLRLVSHLNVSAPLLGKTPSEEEEPEAGQTIAPGKPSDQMPPSWRPVLPEQPFLRSQGWQWFISATKHYGSSGAGPGLGEYRMKLDSCHLLSYYTPNFEDLTEARLESEQKKFNLTAEGHWQGPGQSDMRKNSTAARKEALEQLTRRRRQHNLEDASEEDARKMRKLSTEALQAMNSGNEECSELDWLSLATGIISNNAQDLQILERLLEVFPQTTNFTETRGNLSMIRSQLHVFTLPFLVYPANPREDGVWSTTGPLYKTTLHHCIFQHTQLLDRRLNQPVPLTPTEEELKSTVEEISSSICTVTLTIAFSLEEMFFKHYNNPISSIPPSSKSYQKLWSEIRHWHEGIQELRAWLGWASEWTQCDTVCGLTEKCYIPMWPMIALDRGGPTFGPPPPSRNRTEGGRGPGYGHGYGHDRYGRPGYGRPPNFGGELDDTDLWRPRCVDVDVIMGPEGSLSRSGG